VSKSNGRIWPYAIGTSITLVFSFCVATIVVTQSTNLQPSDNYMSYYQDADANANELIEARIAFDKKYKIEYINNGLFSQDSIVKYKLTDLNGNPISDATLVIAISRPETKKFNQRLENPNVENGIYSFNDATFPKAGIWNIIAKITKGEDTRFLNIKADTRKKEVSEF